MASRREAGVQARGEDRWRMRGPARVAGRIVPPGDKSLAHRALILAALSAGACRLQHLPDGDDVERTRAALAALGVRMQPARGAVTVHGVGLCGLHPARAALDCGNSGTTMRLLAGVLAAQPFVTVLAGDASLLRRPMRRIAAPLTAMGARVACLGAGARPPLRVGPAARLRGARHRLRVDSAQVRSALLLAGLHADGPTRIEPAGASRDHTERMLAALGVHLQRDAGGIELHPTGGWHGFDLDVPGDVSSAAFAVALAAATPGAWLDVGGVGLNPGRARYLEVLRAAGADVRLRRRGESLGEPWGDVRVRGGGLRALELAGDDVVRCLDEIPALVAAAAAAGAGARVRDAAELRAKESDRIAGLARILSAFGARVTTRRDGLTLAAGTRLRPARVGSDGDHRLAMAAAVLALAAPGASVIHGTACVRTSYPGFAADMNRLVR